MEEMKLETTELRKALSLNIKKQRKIFGMTQEKLAEAANLSSQTINDIEGCRMWASDKTIKKLAQVLHIDAYQLFSPIVPNNALTPEYVSKKEFLGDLEGNIIRIIKHQFDEASKREIKM